MIFVPAAERDFVSVAKRDVGLSYWTKLCIRSRGRLLVSLFVLSCVSVADNGDPSIIRTMSGPQ